MCEGWCYERIMIGDATYVCRRREHPATEPHEAGHNGEVLLTWDDAGIATVDATVASKLLRDTMDGAMQQMAPIYKKVRDALALTELASKMHPSPLMRVGK